MKLRITLICCMILLVFNLHTTNTMATATIKITVDDQVIEYSDEYGYPFIDQQNRTQVPLRKSVEFAGAQVSWDSENKIATATYQETTVEIPINKDFIIVNGNKVNNDTSAVIIDGRTYCPIRKVFEAFGFSVSWDQATSTVVVETYDESTPITSELLEDWIPLYIISDSLSNSNPYSFSVKVSVISNTIHSSEEEYVLYNTSTDHVLTGLKSYFLLHEYEDWEVAFNNITVMNKQGYLLFNRSDLKELGFLE